MQTKTKIMDFNFSKKYDFFLKMVLGGKQLEVVRSAKLLGIIKWILILSNFGGISRDVPLK